jgi:hypothetical protein
VDWAGGYNGAFTANFRVDEHQAADASMVGGVAMQWRQLKVAAFTGWLHHEYRYTEGTAGAFRGESARLHGLMAGIRVGLSGSAIENGSTSR